MATTPRLHVSPPTLTPPGFGLLSVAQTPDASDPHWQAEGIEWPTGCINLDSLGLTRENCLPADAGDPTPTGPDKTEGRPRGIGAARVGPAFTLYASHICSTGGRALAQDIARVGQVLTAGESYTVAQAVEVGADDDTLAPHSLKETASLFDAATVAANAQALVALLESSAGFAFPGMVPTLHLPRYIAILAMGEGVIVRNGARLETVTGAPVSADPGFFGAAPTAAPPELSGGALAWGYATGPVMAYRTAPFLPATGEVGTLVAETNDRVVIAERTYAIGWECGAIAIPVDTSYLFVPAPEEP